MANTTNLGLPLMSAAQSQKHITHNDALLRLDAIVQLSAISAALTAPPGSPTAGDTYIIGSGATGAWAGKDLNVTYYSSGAWVFVVPREGWLSWNKATDTLLVWNGSAWIDFATAGGFVSSTTINNNTLPGRLTMLGLGGATADTTNRLSANTPSVLFNRGTDNINVTLNKQAAANDARFTLQTNFSTRALFGLLANDDFSVSVSPNGSTFYSALAINKDTGNVAIGARSDGTNRLLVSGTNNLFTSSGNLAFTFNKGAAANDARLTFQSGFSARALVGLLGNDDFTFKVTPDGSTYYTAMVIDKDNGAVDFSAGAKFSAYCNFGQDYTAGAWQSLFANNTRHNDQSAFASVSNVGIFTAPTDGYYIFGLGVTYEAGSAPTKMQIGLSVNDATPTADTINSAGDATITSGETSCATTACLKLTAGQTVRGKVFFTTNNGRVLANENYFWGARVA